MSKYKLPDVIGGGEVEATEVWGGCAGGHPEYKIGVVTVLMPPGQPLERVWPALPLVFTVGEAGPFWSREDGTAINLFSGDEWTRQELEDLGSEPVPMVAGPAPWEPIGLPWDRTTEDDDMVEVRVMEALNGKTCAVLGLVVDADSIEKLPHGQVRAWAFVPADEVSRALWSAQGEVDLQEALQ